MVIDNYRILRQNSRLQNNFNRLDFLATRLEVKGCFALNPLSLMAFQMVTKDLSLEAIQGLHFFQNQAAFASSFSSFPFFVAYQPSFCPFVSFFLNLFPTLELLHVFQILVVFLDQVVCGYRFYLVCRYEPQSKYPNICLAH